MDDDDFHFDRTVTVKGLVRIDVTRCSTSDRDVQITVTTEGNWYSRLTVFLPKSAAAQLGAVLLASVEE